MQTGQTSSRTGQTGLEAVGWAVSVLCLWSWSVQFFWSMCKCRDVEFAGRSPPRGRYEFGRGRIFDSRKGYGPCFPFRGACTPPARRKWFPRGGSNFDRCDRMVLLTPLSRRLLDTGLTFLVLTLVLSCLLALVLGFELQEGGPENMWLRSWVVLLPHLVVSRKYITFGKDGQGRGISEWVVKVRRFGTLKCVALVKLLGSFAPCPYSCASYAPWP
jgi:hypothetical protein